MISSPNRSARGSTPVRLVVIHTAEGALDVTALGNYFSQSAVQVSSHVGIDDHGQEQYVPYTEAAWTVRSANAISDNAELCGFAAWTRQQWLTDHHPMLVNTAGWIRERCAARNIPLVKLTPAQVGAGQAGVCGHIDWTLGAHDGTHTDPGPGFPWDVVMQLAGAPAPSPSEDDLTPDQADQLALLVTQLVTGPDAKAWGWPTFPGGSQNRFTVVDYLRHLDQRGEDTMRELAVLAGKVAALPAQAPSSSAGLSSADKDDIAARVVALLGAKTSA